MRPIRLTEAAKRDLLEIETYGRAHFGMKFEKFEARLKAKLQQIALYPLSGRRHLDFELPLRSVLISPYILFYLIDDNGIIVIRVFHQAVSSRELLRLAILRPPSSNDA